MAGETFSVVDCRLFTMESVWDLRHSRLSLRERTRLAARETFMLVRESRRSFRGAKGDYGVESLLL